MDPMAPKMKVAENDIGVGVTGGADLPDKVETRRDVLGCTFAARGHLALPQSAGLISGQPGPAVELECLARIDRDRSAHPIDVADAHQRIGSTENCRLLIGTHGLRRIERACRPVRH